MGIKKQINYLENWRIIVGNERAFEKELLFYTAVDNIFGSCAYYHIDGSL
jgi:hypothetical protein